ncbi:ATP-dependent DNA helicase At3g02060, chloroplastic [Linum perenne]
MKYTPVPKKTYIHHFTVSLPSLLLSYTAAVTLSCFSAIQLLTEISPLLSPLLRILQSAMASLDAFSSSSSLISSLHTFPYQLPTWSFFHLKCPSSLTHRYLSSSPFSSSLSSSLHVPSATSAAAAVPSPPRYRPGADTIHDGNDPISLLNLRIRTTRTTRDSSSSSRPSIDPQEAERYMQLVKEQQQRGLQKLKGDRQSTSGASFSYKVDPYTLVSGDYVVHRKAGIGRFVAIKYDVPNTSSRSEPIEYVFLEYADGMAKLPLRQASRLLYRYNLPNESKRPKTLNKLSDPGAWEKRKTKGKVAIQRMVVDLMELYLHRLKQRRPPYPKSPDMADFDAQFPYNPTPDQKQAFNDVERDLTERQTPMDRLICGDVGFGKTEVALRAIFFVVSAGKQTMILAPTIVLAKQHFDVISQRFSRYPNVKVGLLSRFQTRAEKVTYLRMIESGELNIVIGTHSLLGSRVVYNNLGLLVVDEEQRFGVKQKEKIASFKTSVDVLTLSATPIPRTLYLALTGFRDASLISTPPPERVPIKTHLSPYNEEKIALAIKNELDRGGQVFYVLPRIKGLEEVNDFLERSFPDVQIATAHGKLYSKQLEQTMEKFAFGEIKILICTNIVESGIDIPNANTIIIQDVQFFGLSQLHQLRGRVGRADKEAHAYLFYPDRSLLTEQALERLQAMEECVDLGQGFQIAERDMGIRGFGTIFGEQQTGDVGNVGIDLFFEMLFESLSKVEEHCVVSVPYKSVQVDLNVIPRHSSEYINFLDNPIEIIEEAEKAAEKDLWSLVQFTENLRRQYGKEPYSMEILLKKLYVRRMAADMGITRIYASGKMVGMQTNMSKGVFELMSESMSSNARKNSLVLEGDVIKVKALNILQAELLLELHSEQLLNWVFQCLSELHACLPWVMKY